MHAFQLPIFRKPRALKSLPCFAPPRILDLKDVPTGPASPENFRATTEEPVIIGFDPKAGTDAILRHEDPAYAAMRTLRAPAPRQPGNRQ
jgi:hypothetical protein